MPVIRVQTNEPQARPHGTRGHVTFQDTQDCGRGNMKRRAQTTCADCNKSFGRPQELSRHRQDVHKKPRHCLFCGVKWTRPSNIKAHLLTKHREKFTAELLVVIQALRGRTIVAFLDGYTEGPSVAVEVGFHSLVTQTSPILMCCARNSIHRACRNASHAIPNCRNSYWSSPCRLSLMLPWPRTLLRCYLLYIFP
jgi:hypothetical protein